MICERHPQLRVKWHAVRPKNGFDANAPESLDFVNVDQYTTVSSPLGVQDSRAYSSAGEHFVDIEGVTGSIPVTPTMFP